VKLLKIDTEGTISEFNTPGSPDELLPDLKEVFGNWVEVVSLPVVFNGYGQLIGLVNDVGAIDENTVDKLCFGAMFISPPWTILILTPPLSLFPTTIHLRISLSYWVNSSFAKTDFC
jgi:hypothetical protein